MNENQKKLRLLQAKYGLTSREVGKLIHRNPCTVRRYMCGVSLISDELIWALEDAIKNSQSENKRG